MASSIVRKSEMASQPSSASVAPSAEAIFRRATNAIPPVCSKRFKLASLTPAAAASPGILSVRWSFRQGPRSTTSMRRLSPERRRPRSG